MRLDKYLHDSKLVSSRSKAKNAILSGLVHVNGILIKDPDFDIKGTEKIIVNELSEMPKGYFKLQNLLLETKAIDKGDVVLDLGSSAGGYVLAAKEKASKIYGIEISPEFQKTLKLIEKNNSNIKVAIDNVFKCDIDKVCPEKVDVILNDMTLEPIFSFAGLERFLPKLKTGGKVLMTIKLQGSTIGDATDLIEMMCNKNNLNLIRIIESDTKDECFIYAQKLPTKFGR